LISDNEIRAKLQDRNRSPLKMGDLYEGNSSSQIVHNLPMREESARDLNLLSLKKCETASQKSLQKISQDQYSQKPFDMKQWSPLRSHYREPSPDIL